MKYEFVYQLQLTFTNLIGYMSFESNMMSIYVWSMDDQYKEK